METQISEHSRNKN